jgi:hypothetical protein
MMRFLTEDARLVCAHPGGTVKIQSSQRWVTIERRAILVATDPERCDIIGCSNLIPPNVPCRKSEAVNEGYSTFIRIERRPVCLETVTGLTDGTVRGAVFYSVAAPGQSLVTEQ